MSVFRHDARSREQNVNQITIKSRVFTNQCSDMAYLMVSLNINKEPNGLEMYQSDINIISYSSHDSNQSISDGCLSVYDYFINLTVMILYIFFYFTYCIFVT